MSFFHMVWKGTKASTFHLFDIPKYNIDIRPTNNNPAKLIVVLPDNLFHLKFSLVVYLLVNESLETYADLRK